MRNQKGITLVALMVTVIILMIIGAVGINTSVERSKANSLKRLFTDIEYLDDRISDYYLKYKKLPVVENDQGQEIVANTIYTGFDEELVNSNTRIIDLSKLDNISLTYGKDFNNVISNTELTVDNTDIYVIDVETFQIIYLKGITYNKKTYYTKEKAKLENSGRSAFVEVVKGESTENPNEYYCDITIKMGVYSTYKGSKIFSITKNDETIVSEIGPGIKRLQQVGIYKIYLGDSSTGELITTINLVHKWRETTTQKYATCTNTEEVKIRKCEICGAEEIINSNIVVNHKFGDWVVTKEDTCRRRRRKTKNMSILWLY